MPYFPDTQDVRKSTKSLKPHVDLTSEKDTIAHGPTKDKSSGKGGACIIPIHGRRWTKKHGVSKQVVHEMKEILNHPDNLSAQNGSENSADGAALASALRKCRATTLKEYQATRGQDGCIDDVDFSGYSDATVECFVRGASDAQAIADMYEYENFNVIRTLNNEIDKRCKAVLNGDVKFKANGEIDKRCSYWKNGGR